MNILGIETSCDETAAAVVKDGIIIISSVIASSAEMHIRSGGIIPEKAAREQTKSILPVIDHSLVQAKTDPEKIDAIAVTIGPGLIGSLLVGVEVARTLSYLWKKPVIPVNHLLAHIYANWLTGRPDPEFPALALVVSGGHTDLVLITDHSKLTWIGGTRDDAAGEAFDKTARLLGLPYPGGPSIGKEAAKYLDTHPQAPLNLFPRPMLKNDNFDWSFSGLKTAVYREVNNKKFDPSHMAAEVQEAIVDVLVVKTLKAINLYEPKSLLLAGGVAANLRLRETFENQIRRSKIKVDFRLPPIGLCTDNAAIVASAAFFNNRPVSAELLEVNPALSITGQF